MSEPWGDHFGHIAWTAHFSCVASIAGPAYILRYVDAELNIVSSDKYEDDGDHRN